MGLATVGVGAYSTGLVVFHLVRMAILPADASRPYAVAVVAAVCYTPLMVWLVVSAARGQRPRGRWWALAAMALIVVGTLPVVGADWLGAIEYLAGTVLVVVRPPWSVALFFGMVAAMAPVAVVLGSPGWAVYFTMGMLLVAPAMAAPARLLAAVRQLDAARQALAEEAIVRERLRIDAELGRTLGTALETIVERGDEACAIALSDPGGAARGVRALVEGSRRTLADARLLARQYRREPAHIELDLAAQLLTAGGIRTSLELPPDPAALTLPEPLRAVLHADTARLLADDTVGECVIAVTQWGDMLKLELRTGGPLKAYREPGS